MKHRRSVLSLLLCLGALTSAGMPSLSQQATDTQQKQEEPSGAFTASVNVHLVNVDVYVTDKKGNPITGLSADDFQLFEDGHPVKVTNFYAVTDGHPAQEATTAPEPEAAPVAPAPAPTPTPTPQEALPEEQRLWLIVYIDNYNTAPLNRNRIFRDLRQYLYQNVTPRDRVMLVSYNRTLNVQQSFTGDPQAIGRALLSLQSHAGKSSSYAQDRKDLMREIEDANSAAEVRGRVTQFARSIRNDMLFTIDAMRQMVDSLAGLPGRKVLLYVSDGLPLTPAKDLFYAMQRKFSDQTALSSAMEFDTSRNFKELAQAANANRVSFYTIDATGLVLSTGIAAENKGGSYEDDMRSSTEALAQTNEQDSIRLIAERTGGKAIVNTNDIGPGLEEMGRALNNYYSLGYSPVHPGDGRYHRIEVKVDRKDAELRYREGYRDRSETDRMADRVRASLRYGSEDNPLAVLIDPGTPTPHGDGTFVVPVAIKVPLDKITLIPQGDYHTGSLSIYFSAMDTDGDLSDVRHVRLPIQIPNDDMEKALKQVYGYHVELLLRSGRQRVAVAVADEFGGQEAFVGKTLSIAR